MTSLPKAFNTSYYHNALQDSYAVDDTQRKARQLVFFPSSMPIAFSVLDVLHPQYPFSQKQSHPRQNYATAKSQYLHFLHSNQSYLLHPLPSV